MGVRVNSRTVTYVAVAVATFVGLFFIIFRPIGMPDPDPAPAAGTTLTRTGSPTSSSAHATSTTTTTRSTPTTTPTSTATCLDGTPARMRYPALGVNASFERIGLDRTLPPDASGKYPLGNPKDRTKAGWYADGPRPGSGQGTILTNGHTYRNGSAIFKEDFARRIAPGQLIHITQDNGSVCSYAVERVWREVDAKRDYPRIITSEKLYDFEGPERLFLVTCGGSWNAAAQNYDEISILIATPVGR